MKIVYRPEAEEQLDKMDAGLRRLFFKHAEKVSQMPPKRHLRFGIPLHCEEVTRQARLVYRFEDENTCQIFRCFTTHKEYERWYKSYK
ncbi:MAG: hypothetical protein V1777_02325 [Candidatus Micrarchaeota archaeon]